MKEMFRFPHHRRLLQGVIASFYVVLNSPIDETEKNRIKNSQHAINSSVFNGLKTAFGKEVRLAG